MKTKIKQLTNSLRVKFKFTQGLAIGLTCSSLVAYAVVSLPNTFTTGTTI